MSKKVFLVLLLSLSLLISFAPIKTFAAAMQSYAISLPTDPAIGDRCTTNLRLGALNIAIDRCYGEDNNMNQGWTTGYIDISFN